MSEPITVALDAMGGDVGVDVVVPATVTVLKKHPSLHIVLVGDESLLAQKCRENGLQDHPRVSIKHASQVVAMDDPPALALRNKKDSSMRVAINLVKSREVQACVSAGNTGALMAISRFVLKMLPGIDRPAIISTIPALQGHTHMLDLGANVDCRAEHLHQFAVMGAELAAAVDGLANPRVGLLNIGEEDIKGNETVKEAAKLLEASDLNYIGYVEGNEINARRADVVVCDGFVGNVSLKTCEGVAKMIAEFLRQEFNRTWWTKLCGLAALPVLNTLRNRIDPRRYNGASLLGLQGIVIKSHGGADALAFAHAVDIAVLEVEQDVPNKIGQHIQTHLTECA